MLAKAFNSSVFENDATLDDFASSHEHNFSSHSDINESMVMGPYGYGCFDITCAPEKQLFDLLAFRRVFLHIIHTAMLPTACIGIALNTAGTYFLLHGKGHKQMFNLLLAINLIFDTMYLLCHTLINQQRHFDSLNPPVIARAIYYKMAVSGAHMSFIISVLMLVALAHSRYKAVTNPYEGRTIRLYGSVRRKQLLKYLLPAIFLATCFTTISLVEDLSKLQNGNVFYFQTDMPITKYHQIFFHGIFHVIFLGVFPFASLLYFTYHIKKALNRRYTFIDYAQPHDDNMERTTRNDANAINDVQPRNNIIMMRCKNNKASKTLFLLISIFLLLHSGRLIGNLCAMILALRLNNISGDDMVDEFWSGDRSWLQEMLVLSDMFMVINASINFLVYMFLNSSITIKNVSFCKPPCLSKPSCSQQNKDIVLHEVGIQRITSEVVAKVDIVSACSPVDKRINEGVSFVVAKTREEWL